MAKINPKITNTDVNNGNTIQIQESMYDIDFGKVIKMVRQAKGWTQGKLGSKTGRSKPRISAIEHSGNNLLLSTIIELLQAMGAEVTMETTFKGRQA